jgi:hypothetical protein
LRNVAFPNVKKSGQNLRLNALKHVFRGIAIITRTNVKFKQFAKTRL